MADNPEATQRDEQLEAQQRELEELKAEQELFRQELQRQKEINDRKDAEIRALSEESRLPRADIEPIPPAIVEEEPIYDEEPIEVVEDGLGFFFKELAPHGVWFQSQEFGYVWQPRNAQHVDWQPYADGYWVYSDEGWTWISNEVFGWAVYHYGRWALLENYGWVWVPGDVWAPAWVDWRYSDDYIGWAPLPPETLDHHVYISGGDYGLSYHSYCYVTIVNFHRHHKASRIARSRNLMLYGITQHLERDRGRVHGHGPRVDWLKSRHGGEITRYKIQRDRQQNVRLRDNDANIRNGVVHQYAPRLKVDYYKARLTGVQKKLDRVREVRRNDFNDTTKARDARGVYDQSKWGARRKQQSTPTPSRATSQTDRNNPAIEERARLLADQQRDARNRKAALEQRRTENLAREQQESNRRMRELELKLQNDQRDAATRDDAMRRMLENERRKNELNTRTTQEQARRNAFEKQKADALEKMQKSREQSELARKLRDEKAKEAQAERVRKQQEDLKKREENKRLKDQADQEKARQIQEDSAKKEESRRQIENADNQRRELEKAKSESERKAREDQAKHARELLEQKREELAQNAKEQADQQREDQVQKAREQAEQQREEQAQRAREQAERQREEQAQRAREQAERQREEQAQSAREQAERQREEQAQRAREQAERQREEQAQRAREQAERQREEQAQRAREQVEQQREEQAQRAREQAERQREEQAQRAREQAERQRQQ